MVTVSERHAPALLATPPAPISWGAVLAGAVTALGVWVLLLALGLALGLSAVDPRSVDTARTAGIFTGIWALAAPVLALLAGGFVAGRTSTLVSRSGGLMHGLVMWAFTALLGLWVLGRVASTLVGGVASVGASAVQATGSAIAGGASHAEGLMPLARSFGLDANDALTPVNQRLVAEGKPPVTEDQLQAAVRDVVQSGIREGRIDRELLVQSLAQNTALRRSDAEELAGRIEQQFDRFKAQTSQNLQDVAHTAQTTALKAADTTGTAMWGVFGALLLGLAATLGGSLLGVGQRRRVITRAEEDSALMAGVPGEVYP